MLQLWANKYINSFTTYEYEYILNANKYYVTHTQCITEMPYLGHDTQLQLAALYNFTNCLHWKKFQFVFFLFMQLVFFSPLHYKV